MDVICLQGSWHSEPTTCGNEDSKGREHFRKRMNRIWRMTGLGKDGFKILVHSQEELADRFPKYIKYRRNFLGGYFWVNRSLGWWDEGGGCLQVELDAYLAHFQILNSCRT